MNRTKKLLAMLLVLVMAVGMFGGLTANAVVISTDNNPVTSDIVKIVATRSGDNITYTVKSTVEREMNAIELTLIPNEALEYVDYDKMAYENSAKNNVELFWSISTGTPKTYAADESMLSFTFKVKDGFEEKTNYDVKFAFDFIADKDGNMYVEDLGLTAIYREDPEVVTHLVTFFSNGQTVDTKDIVDGETVSAIADPTRDGYTFGGWQLNGADYDFTTPVTSDITLTAKWTKDAGTISKEIDLTGVEVSKTVDSSVSVPSERFEFDFENTKFEPKTSSDKDGVSAPALGPVYINYSDETSATLGKVDFPVAGVYTYKVTEKSGSTDGMSYDETVYYLVITVEEIDQDGNLGLTYAKVYNEAMTDKTGSLNFTNTYTPTTELEVSKTVVGDPAIDKEFTFTIKFTAPGVANDSKVTLKVGDETVEIPYGADYEFKLKDGETVKFENVLEGATYTLTETGTEYYTGAAVIYSGDTSSDVKGNYAEDLVCNGTIASDNNAVEVTNTYSITPDTGVSVNYEMIVIGLLAVLALAGGFVISRKLRKAED